MSYLPGSLYTYQTVTSTPTPQIIANRIAYVCRGSGLLSFKLPASAMAGMSFKIIGKTSLWEIQQNAGQSITFGMVVSNTGVTGGLSSTFVADRIEIECLTANTEYNVCDASGNINYT